jgi:hypothetical protein
VTGNRRGQSSALHYLGLIAEKSGDTATARSLLTQATALRREVGLRDDATESLFDWPASNTMQGIWMPLAISPNRH